VVECVSNEELIFVCLREITEGQSAWCQPASTTARGHDEPPSTNQLDGEATASRKVLDALVVDMPSLGSAVPVAAGPSTTSTVGAAGTADPAGEDDLRPQPARSLSTATRKSSSWVGPVEVVGGGVCGSCRGEWVAKGDELELGARQEKKGVKSQSRAQRGFARHSDLEIALRGMLMDHLGATG